MKRPPIDANDVVALVGLGLLGYGLWWVYWPLAFIVPGVLLLMVAMASAWSRSRQS